MHSNTGRVPANALITAAISARIGAADRKRRMQGSSRVPAAVAALVAVLAAAGCSGSSRPVVVNPTGVSTFPTAAAAAPVNTYIGTQSPGVWSLTVDNTKGTYSYQPTTFPNSPNTPTTGSFTASNGFLSLGQANGASLGYILEVPGRLAILRPGDTSAPLVMGVPQTSCYSIPYRLRFDYIGINAVPTTSAAPPSIPLAFGSFVANSSSDGGTWQYQNVQGNAPFGPAGFTGACAVANGQTAMNLSGQPIFDQYYGSTSLAQATVQFNTTLAIGPSGIFILDQNSPISLQGSAVAGVAQPVSPLSTSAVAAGRYLGFLTESPDTNITPSGQTSPVSFGQTSSAGATLFGGEFPGDDVTQTPNSDTSINLGSQDTTINGFYPSATITTLDPRENCSNNPGIGQPGINAQGFFTCSYPAVAAVGNPDGKYAVFITTFNYTANTNGTPMQIYLYQQ